VKLMTLLKDALAKMREARNRNRELSAPHFYQS